MIKLSNLAYMKIDNILNEKKSMSSEISDKVNDIRSNLSGELADKFNEVVSLFFNMANSDTEIKEVLEREYHRKIPALHRKHPTSII